jgi:hypothetical protein
MLDESSIDKDSNADTTSNIWQKNTPSVSNLNLKRGFSAVGFISSVKASEVIKNQYLGT